MLSAHWEMTKCELHFHHLLYKIYDTISFEVMNILLRMSLAEGLDVSCFLSIFKKSFHSKLLRIRVPARCLKYECKCKMYEGEMKEANLRRDSTGNRAGVTICPDWEFC